MGGVGGREEGGEEKDRGYLWVAFLPYISLLRWETPWFLMPSFSSTSDINPPSPPTHLPSPSRLRRCYRLCLDCRPQHAPLPEPKGMKEEKESEGIFERHQPEEGRDRAPPAVSSSLVDLAIQSNTPRGMVENYVHAFAELHSEGHIDRQLVKLILYVP